jgi:hypothetical protein
MYPTGRTPAKHSHLCASQEKLYQRLFVHSFLSLCSLRRKIAELQAELAVANEMARNAALSGPASPERAGANDEDNDGSFDRRK